METEVITFRVSRQELDQIEAVQEFVGARNRSNFVRDLVVGEVNRQLSLPGNKNLMRDHFQRKVDRIEQEHVPAVQSQLDHAKKMLEQVSSNKT